MIDRQWREEWRYDSNYGKVKQHYRGPAELGGIIGGSLHGGGYWQYQTWDRYGYGVEEGGLPEWNTAGFGRRVTALDAYGAATQATLGNGLTDVRSYSSFTGALTTLCVGAPGSSCGIVRQEYSYNGWSNLISQSQSGGAPAASESFHYDALHRLTTATVSGHGQVTYGYDGSGNLSSKSDYGSNYQYDPVRRHAVVHAVVSVQPAAGPAYTYDYDGNGKQVSLIGADGRSPALLAANLGTVPQLYWQACIARRSNSG